MKQKNVIERQTGLFLGLFTQNKKNNPCTEWAILTFFAQKRTKCAEKG